ncbi:MAG: CehA/McbA family metallohydrolase [Candidatus Omnitrophica bacterium]|nr:CehA/McbA family metallohydrolase [Candidatus Omnitrophota bacterium]
MSRLPLLPAVLLAFSGCSTLPLESSRIPHPSSRESQAVQSPYREAVGVVHVHSTYSDGRLPIEEIAGIANAQQLDYLIITDHDTLAGKFEKKEGWYGQTLVLVGNEISTSGGHYLALRIDTEIPRLKDPAWTIEAVSAAGGLGFVAHPFWPRRHWKNLDARGMTGIEIYSAKEDVTEEPLLILGFWTILAGSELSFSRWIDRPDQHLAYWDRLLNEGRKVVGIGSPDAHGLRRFGLRLGPYSTMFKMVRTHLLLNEITEEAVYDALAKGRCFVAHDLVADAKGFQFLVAGKDKTILGVMGDELTWHPSLRLYAYLPSPGHAILLKDGRLLFERKGQQHWFEVDGPGVYRLEVTRKGKPWIYSNPIYVRPASVDNSSDPMVK